MEIPGGPDNCRITSAQSVAGVFKAKVTAETAGVGGTGSKLCHFTLGRSNIGVPTEISMSLSVISRPAAFGQLRKSTPGAVAIAGVGQDAFYVPATATLQLRSGRTVVVVASRPYAPGAPKPTVTRRAQERTDLTALGKLIAAQL